MIYSIKNEITSLNIISNDNLFLSIINSIKHPVNVLKFITDSSIPNGCRLAYYLQNKSIPPTEPLLPSPSTSVDISKENIEKYPLKNSVKPSVSSVDFSEVRLILKAFSTDTQNTILLLFKNDLINKSIKLND